MSAGKRLKKVRDFLGLTQSGFAEIFGLKWTKIKDIETETHKLTPELAEKIEQNYSINGWWLLTGKGEMFLTENSNNEQNQTQNNYQIEVLNVKASAGYGIENELVEVVDTILLDKSLFKTPINQSKVKLVEVVGDSMYPTIKDGDYVIIDETKNYGIDGIYAINLHNQLLIKRLKFRLDGTVDIISDNHQYHSENYDPKETQVPLHILGIKILTIQR